MSSPRISPAEGSRKSRKRVGRGRSSGLGKTSGRGHKGQGARSGSKKRSWFEGGQMPLQRRIPKRGFTPRSRTVYQTVNLATLAQVEKGATLSPADLAGKGWIKKADGLVKILGDGDIETPFTISAHAFSKSAAEKIQKAGGTVNLLPRFPARDTPSSATDAV